MLQNYYNRLQEIFFKDSQKRVILILSFLLVFFLGYLAANISNIFFSVQYSTLDSLSRRLIVREIDENLDSELNTKISDFKDQLPEDIKNEVNFAYADIKIENHEHEYVTHSKIDEEHVLKTDTADIKMLKLKGELEFGAFDVLGLYEYFLRDKDTEYKIVNTIAQELGDDTEVSGKIILYTDLPPCISCDFAIKKFLEKYPNVSMEVLHR